MKTLRILLLVLLAMLLPVRGAVAGAAHCAGSADDAVGTVAAAQVLHAEVDAHGGEPGHHAGAGQAEHHKPSTGSGEQSLAAADACTLCTASCSSTAFMSELSLAPSLAVAGTLFPALVAPLPSHASEGPERPPRLV